MLSVKLFALIPASSHILSQTQMNPRDIASKHAGTVLYSTALQSVVLALENSPRYSLLDICLTL